MKSFYIFSGRIKWLLVLSVFLSTNDLTAQKVRKTGDLKAKRALHQMQPLPDGKILIFGGQTTNSQLLPVLHSASEIYNPATETWNIAGNMNTPRRNFASVVLSNNKILAIGGSNSTDQSLNSVEEYDPATNTWTEKGNLQNERQKIDAIVMNNGTILVMGGDDVSYESSTDGGLSWKLHEFPVAFGYTFPESPSLINLSDGRVLCIGLHAGSATRNYAILISPALAHDTAKTRLAEDHPNAGLMQLNNGKILITGGTATGTNELFDPVTNMITLTGKFNTSHIACPVMNLSDGRVAAFNIGNTFEDIILELYNPTNGTWMYSTGHDFTGLSAYQTVKLTNGKWLIAGGMEYLGIATTGSLKSFLLEEDAGAINDPIKNSANVYYNPQSNTCEIRLTGNYIDNHFKVYLTDLTGKDIKESSFIGSNENIALPLLPSGIYMIRIISPENNMSVTKRFFIE